MITADQKKEIIEKYARTAGYSLPAPAYSPWNRLP